MGTTDGWYNGKQTASCRNVTRSNGVSLLKGCVSTAKNTGFGRLWLFWGCQKIIFFLSFIYKLFLGRAGNSWDFFCPGQDIYCFFFRPGQDIYWGFFRFIISVPRMGGQQQKHTAHVKLITDQGHPLALLF
jgi:hypothetical protein